MAGSRGWTLLALVVTLGTASAQTVPPEPAIGYLYPAGGRQGTVFEVSAGGQFLQKVEGVLVSGRGVHAKVIRYVPPLTPKALMAVGRELKDKFGMDENGKPVAPAGGRLSSLVPQSVLRGLKRLTGSGEEELDPRERASLEHPMVKQLQMLGPEELKYVVKEFRSRRGQLQRNRQIDETVVLEVTVDADAPPGDRELRLTTALGLTGPLHFQVGQLPETLEHEPNNPDWADLPRIGLPVVVNGQLQAGDIDCCRFQATKGQRLVLSASARALNPFLADAVPGWFQAVLAVYDSAGKQVAYSDDRGFDPDPVILFAAPAAGEYMLVIRDALFRGRRDFVYRVTVSEANPGAVWPEQDPGPWDYVPPETAGLPPVTPSLGWPGTGPLAPVDEVEPDDAPSAAQPVTLPIVIRGSIAKPGDCDRYRFVGQAGQVVVADVMARRDGSPLDGLVRVIDARGKVLAWNDDRKGANLGLLTHDADPYLSVTLPEAGVYQVQVTDALRHGSEYHTYQLRLSPPLPDFALFVSPSTVNVPPGPAVPIEVTVVRRDGFAGAINLGFDGGDQGFALAGGRIPAGRDRIRVTLTAPPGKFDTPVSLRLFGQAPIAGSQVRRVAIPADDLVQAFLWKHLVPAGDLLVGGRGRRAGFRRGLELEPGGPVRLVKGGTVKVPLRVPEHPILDKLHLELSDPPEGITLASVERSPGAMTLVLKAGDAAPEPGYADNLIVAVYLDQMVEPGKKKEKGKPKETAAPEVPEVKQKRRVQVGYLPAIPFELTGVAGKQK